MRYSLIWKEARSKIDLCFCTETKTIFSSCMKIDKNKESRQKHNYGGNNNLGTSIRNMLYDQVFSL